jgi:lipopolysaccharide export system protein LptA
LTNNQSFFIIKITPYPLSPSIYITGAAISIVALSSWFANLQSVGFANSKRTTDAQMVDQFFGKKVSAKADAKILTLADERFRPSAEGDSLIAQRPMGGRSPYSPIGPALPQTKVTAATAPEITGVIEAPEQEETIFRTITADQGFHITADEATKVGSGSDKMLFKGHVSVISPQFRMTSKELIVTMGKGGDGFSLAEGRGSVDVLLTGGPPEKRYHGQSAVAVYNPAKGTLVLTGWPKIQGQTQELIAAAADTKVLLYPATGKMLSEGRTQTRVAKSLIADSTDKKP